ncbi:peptide chain release factor N(5)-glutamine methyltransferase [Bombilactobacillus folatiphilus]|uniref:peptide chain release factor N(5)-glutamine methyltransferase n=1 Tax=Bombilactobacillus folatiphilus TaxID=2923362 RepID=A0ABY4PA92_9LACO|nr:peptide chain release factor N(5)-glutamine methyltransferase [Bombilactobacillus folatiphilus]UQS82668.1 peptide chain release factor N(5)-glutamine methyltransferase [Bombilactobacillus folatiphilus]
MLQDLKQGAEVAQYLLLELTHWTPTQLQFHAQDQLTAQLWSQYQMVVQTAQTGRPPQYILGEAWFYGRQFHVNKDTLIPRQDSEAMIAQILQDQSTGSLLELGTGSGALALTLALEGHYQTVTVTDISDGALAVAAQNAQKCQVSLNLLLGDLFAPVKDQQFDTIVFNPPYISRVETSYMDQSVLDFEPHQALFAPEDGLQYYRLIFAEFQQYLTPNGRLYLEFGFQQQAKISKMFQEQVTGYQLDFYHDLAGQPRFLRIQSEKR